MRKVGLIFVTVIGLALGGCAGDGSDRGKEIAGTGIGAAIGGLIGSQIGDGTGQLIATAVGVVAGGFIGNELGKSLDNADRQAAYSNAQQSLETQPSGTTTSWSNPDSGAQGTFTPQPAVQTASGTYCRPYEQTITVDGQTERSSGTACRQPDGTWKIQN